MLASVFNAHSTGITITKVIAITFAISILLTLVSTIGYNHLSLYIYMATLMCWLLPANRSTNQCTDCGATTAITSKT